MHTTACPHANWHLVIAETADIVLCAYDRNGAGVGTRIRGIDDADDASPAAALVRQEAEGGALLISALLRSTPTGTMLLLAC